MKLYLSSYRIPNDKSLIKLLPKSVQDTSICIVANAKDYLIERARKVKVESITEYLAEVGFKYIAELDLREYKSIENLDNDLRKCNAIFVAGGNTFCLNEQIKNSGFDRLIDKRVGDGLVYIGESAGAVIAGKSLKGIEPDDEPRFAESINFDGLNLVDKFVLPHADNQFFSESNQTARKIYAPDEILVLNDNQAYVVDGNLSETVSGEK